MLQDMQKPDWSVEMLETVNTLWWGYVKVSSEVSIWDVAPDVKNFVIKMYANSS